MSSVAALQPAVVVFREEQYFDWRVYARGDRGPDRLFLPERPLVDRPGQLALAGAGHPQAGLPRDRAARRGGPDRLRLLAASPDDDRVSGPSEIRIWFGWVPFYRRNIAVDSVRTIEVVTYRPLLDHGGWGIRSGPEGERVLSARGNRGVRLVLNDGTRILIGSQRPEALAIAIERSLGADMGN